VARDRAQGARGRKPGRAGERGLFRAGALARLVDDHRAGRRNHAGRLWALTVLEVWFERYAPDYRLAA
jgi:asparagine synthase (glutamine-hydrolysing)